MLKLSLNAVQDVVRAHATTSRTSAGYWTPSSRSYADQASTGWPFPQHSGGDRHLSAKWSSQWNRRHGRRER